MADQRIQYTEEMVGANHPTKDDTLNRLLNVEHDTDGSHKSVTVDQIDEKTAAHGVVIDGITLKDGGALAITGGTNTFNLTNGTASLDVAAGAAVNIDEGLTVTKAATLTTELHVTAPATHIADAATGFTIAGGTTSKTLVVPANVTLPTITAGGIPYGSAADVWSNLAKGAANFKLFMNAGATAPEWALGINVITVTREMDATGAPTNVAYTGVGFKPSGILFYGGTSQSNFIGHSVSGAGDYGYTQTGTTGSIPVANCVFLWESAGKTQAATTVSYDADGFTLAWTRTGATASQTAYFAALCWR